jgi:hypothetical protein
VRRTRTSRSSDRRLESIVASPASSQRLQISALRPSLPRESRRKGHSADGRRSGSTKSPSFDEAAVAANLALPSGERDRERQRRACDRPRGRIRHREGAPSEGSRSRAYRSETRWSPGKPGDIDGQAEARGSPSSEALPEVTSFAKASAGRAAVEATVRGERRRRG